MFAWVESVDDFTRVLQCSQDQMLQQILRLSFQSHKCQPSSLSHPWESVVPTEDSERWLVSWAGISLQLKQSLSWFSHTIYFCGSSNCCWYCSFELFQDRILWWCPKEWDNEQQSGFWCWFWMRTDGWYVMGSSHRAVKGEHAMSCCFLHRILPESNNAYDMILCESKDLL